jgi:hypothetical protein
MNSSDSESLEFEGRGNIFVLTDLRMIVFLGMSIRKQILSTKSDSYLMLFFSVRWELSLAVLRLIIMPHRFRKKRGVEEVSI